MKTQKSIIIVLCFSIIPLLFIAAKSIKAYNNPLTGEVQFNDWSKTVNGLQCRLGTPKAKLVRGDTPIVVLQVRNVTSKSIAINDLLYPNMLVQFETIRESRKTYSDRDFQWIFDESRNTLPSEATIEAVCRIPVKLLKDEGKHKLFLSIRRGVYPSGSKGIPKRGENWWTGAMKTQALMITIQE